jgi:hypothetical protein
MQSQARYWIFFVIVAVGLVLSWGQVGRKTERAIAERPVVYLVAERPCRPRQAPCAALAGDRALVLGPAGDGLRLRQAGFAGDTLVRIDIEYVDGLDEVIQRGGVDPALADWRLQSPPAGARRLRVSVESNVDLSVAEFPLPAATAGANDTT